MEWFGQICGLMLICCGLLVVCAQICGLTVRFLGGGCLFSLPDLVFGVVGGGFMVYVHLGGGGGCWCLLLIWGGWWWLAFSRILSFQTLENILR